MKYEKIPWASAKDRFFINRLRKYLLNPSQDWALEKEIREGKHIGLEWLLTDDEGDSYDGYGGSDRKNYTVMNIMHLGTRLAWVHFQYII